MDPYTVFDTAAAWRGFILTLPEFYLTGSSLLLGGALAILSWKSPATPKGREKIRARKGWAVPLLLAAAVGFSLWGFFMVGIPRLNDHQLWGIPILTLGAFMAFRFPRVMGIPLAAGVITAVLGLTLVLGSWQPLRPGTPLAHARPMPEDHWELIHAGGSSLVPEDMFPREIWILETDGYLGLSGAEHWVSWKNPQTGGLNEALHGVLQSLGWEKRLKLDIPPAPRMFYTSTLEIITEAELRWLPGL